MSSTLTLRLQWIAAIFHYQFKGMDGQWKVLPAEGGRLRPPAGRP
jgi:hypothetical protein